MDEKPARREIDQPPQPRWDAGKLVMQSVVSHDTLLRMIEQRDPISRDVANGPTEVRPQATPTGHKEHTMPDTDTPPTATERLISSTRGTESFNARAAAPRAGDAGTVSGTFLLPPQGSGAPPRIYSTGSPASEQRLNVAMKVLHDPAARASFSRAYSAKVGAGIAEAARGNRASKLISENQEQHHVCWKDTYSEFRVAGTRARSRPGRRRV